MSKYIFWKGMKNLILKQSNNEIVIKVLIFRYMLWYECLCVFFFKFCVEVLIFSVFGFGDEGFKEVIMVN